MQGRRFGTPANICAQTPSLPIPVGSSARETVQWTVFSENGPGRARWDPMRQHWARAFGRPLERWRAAPEEVVLLAFPFGEGGRAKRGRKRSSSLYKIRRTRRTVFFGRPAQKPELRSCTRCVHPLVQRVSRCRPPGRWGTAMEVSFLLGPGEGDRLRWWGTSPCTFKQKRCHNR
jgi:hypothetical protein